MKLFGKHITPEEFVRAASRPTGLALSAIVVVGATVVLLVPFSQRALAITLGLGLGAVVAILSLHILALTRWTGHLEQRLESQSLEWQPMAESIARLDAYVHAADLNVGRIAMLQTKLEARISELERGLEGAGLKAKRTDKA